tara:strand:- start:77 stop:820 length:744 start_codon:yes stop_codon:yes gene_type:complete
MITKTKPRAWTDLDISELKKLKSKGYSNSEIAKFMDRSEVAIQIKWKRLNKKNNSYNKKHIDNKYETNKNFLNIIKPTTILDLFAGESSYYLELYKELRELNEETFNRVVTNDKNKEFSSNNYNDDALRVLCKLYYEKNKFDLIDIDPFGSAYECFDLAIKMAKKGLIITYGEMGHKRWKRLDYVERFYNINTLEDFTLDKLVAKTQEIGRQNKKKLNPIYVQEWQNIGRVYYQIETMKIDVWKDKK